MVKFRFWDTARNKMYCDGDYWLPDRYIDPCANNCYPIKVTNHGIIYCKKLVENQNYVEVCEDGKKECYYDNWEHDELSSDRVVFGMGVKIDGKWYFEGDIAKCLDTNNEWYISEISWNGGALVIDIQNTDYDYTVIGWALEDYIQEIEIIGNKWDNPELGVGE